MKKPINLICTFFTLALVFSCSDDSVSDEFTDANGNASKKLIKTISTTSAQDPQENKNIILSYTSDGKLNTISDGFETSIFVYDEGELSNITGGGDNLNTEDLYESPYDAFETGYVLIYDENDNPKEIEFYEEEYVYETGNFITKVYTAEVFYDDAPNPYFFTLEAGGIIEVMDDVQLNFSMNPQVPEIVKARSLFPMNNPSQIVYKNEEGELIYTINISYVYDSENYPTSATVINVSIEDSEESTYSAVFEYVN